MNILITGGGGFLGSNLTKKLLEQNHKVYVLDNFMSSSEFNVPYEVKIFYGDVISNSTFTELLTFFDEKGLERIYHLASVASPKLYEAVPYATLLSNVVGTKNMVDLAQTFKARILFSSTSEIYGNPTEHPQKETYNGNVNPFTIRSCYDESKRTGETVMRIAKENGVDVRVARIFNTYGPGMNLKDGRVVVNYIKQALQREPLTIYGTGKQTRSFCYVDDTINGLIKLMESDYDFPVNIGNPKEEVSMLELAYRVLQLVYPDQSSEYYMSMISFKELPENDPSIRRPDITLAKEKLNWRPKVRLDEGLKETIKYVERQLKHA